MNNRIKHKFEAGQVWISSCALHGGSTVQFLVFKREELANDIVLHIAILDGDGPHHMPFKENVLFSCALRMVGNIGDLKKFEEGYNYWKKYYEMGEAGVYAIKLCDALGM